MYATLPVFQLAILSGLLSAIVVAVAYWQCRTQSRLLRYSFVGLALAGVLWAVGYAAYLFVDPAESYLALRVLWLGAIPFVTLWVVFVLAYTGHDRLLTRSTLGLLAIEPLVVLAAALTTTSHGLFVGGEATGTVGDFLVTMPTAGPLFAFHQVYLFLLVNVSLLFLVRTLGDTDPAYHPQLLALIAAGAVPLFDPIQQLFNLSAAAIHGTPLLLSVSWVLVLLAIAQYRLFDILPTARNRVLSTMEDGVVLIDDDGRIRLANTAARRQLSLPEPVIGRAAADVLPCGDQLLEFCRDDGLPENSMHAAGPESGISLRTDGGSAQLRPHPAGAELILDRDEESHFIVSTEPVPVDTAVEGTLLVFRDITDQREQALEFQAVIEHTSDVVTIVEPDGEITYVSPSVESELAYTQLELVGENVAELFHPDDIDAVRAEIEAVVDTDETIGSQYRMETGDGDWRMVETTVRGSRSSPTTDGVIITTRDVTERYRHQQRRRVMNRVLRHDLRNDMNVVAGHAEILVESLDSERVRHAETIHQKASNLVRLGEKVRKIDQRLHGRDRELKRVDLGRIIQEEVSSIHKSYPETSIRTRIDDITIWGDTLVRSAIQNVLENAIEHNDQAAPEIDVVATHDDETDRIEIEISDNGPGVPEAERRVITAGVETPLEHISGLGLWLVKWIVEGMDGELAIENADPRGSVVTLSFPPVETAIESADEESAPVGGPGGGGLQPAIGSESGDSPIRTTTRSQE
ncbi:MAG: histidine kinase N-terminal 7TM domain-containing protein [Halohasta sp.]